MNVWYFSYDGKSIGPFDHARAVEQAAANPKGHAWRAGFTDWLPISDVAELSRTAGSAGSGGSGGSGGSPAGPSPTGQRFLPDDIEYKIFGAEMQFVEIALDPGESAVAEAGALMYKDQSIQLATIFGDGSVTGGNGGIMDQLFGAGKRILTGESLFTTLFTQSGSGKGRVAFAAPYPGTILPVNLKQLGGRLICQKDSFLCAARGVSIGIHFQRRILTGLFGGEGFIMQKLEGEGLVFVHAGGMVVERQLGPGEILHVDTGCLVALQDTVEYDIQQVGGIRSILFGGEGLFLVTLRGPGRVWLQSLPFSRLAGRMLQAAPAKDGGRDEGSILGPIGDILRGDR
jgi:uncharacterized protein (TIGR00266 family)